MSDEQWHYAKNGVRQGPASTAQMQEMAQRGQIVRSDMVWRPGLADWVQAGSMPELFASAPPPLPAGAPPMSYYAPQAPARGAGIGADAGIRMLLPVGRSGWAIAAGYLGLLSVLLLPAPLALLCGILAIVDMKRHPDRHGMGRAIFGIIMGILGIVFFVLLFVGRVFR